MPLIPPSSPSYRSALTWDPSESGQPAVRADGRREPPRAHHAFLDYLRLGPGRSISSLFERYQEQEYPPSRSLGTLRMWSSHYDWPARASAFDQIEDEQADAGYRAYREAVIQSGLALDSQRVEQLSSIYQKLAGLALTEEALWVRNVKTIQLGDGRVERVELRRFNGELIRILRGLLDDLAGETGGRSSRSPLPSRAADPGQDLNGISLDVLSPEERCEYIRLQDKLFANPMEREHFIEKL